MDFAKKVLNKYGWKEGQGLGKNNDGIAKPLRAFMKFDNMGLGVDRAKEFNDHWWERCFNEAASNMDITSSKMDGSIKVNVKDAENGVEITTNSYSVDKLKKAKTLMGDDKVKYGNFIYAASLTNTGNTIENPFKVSLDDIAVKPVNVLTDEELFKACGGRTAHKGARHGLKLSGKLARLEQQEAELLAKMQKIKENAASSTNDTVKQQKPLKSKKCKKKSKKHEDTRAKDENMEKEAKKSKKRKISASEIGVEKDKTSNIELDKNPNTTQLETDSKFRKKKRSKQEKNQNDSVVLTENEKECDMKEAIVENITKGKNDIGEIKKKHKKNKKI